MTTLLHAHVRNDDGAPTSDPSRFALAHVYENAPDLVEWLSSEMMTYGVKPEIEAFDLSMNFQTVNMAKAGRIQAVLHVQFLMGVKNATPVDRDVFEFYIRTLKRLAPDAT